MTEDTDMKRIVYGLDGDAGVPVIANVPTTTDMGPALISIVGTGNPYWAWNDPDLITAIMTANDIGVNFDGAPLCSDDEQINRVNVSALCANPVANGLTDNNTNKVWVVD